MAKLLFTPIGFIAALLSGRAAGKLFNRIWAQFDDNDPPRPHHEDHELPRILAVAAVQGAVFAIVKALVNNSLRRWFRFLFGTWPGDKKAA